MKYLLTIILSLGTIFSAHSHAILGSLMSYSVSPEAKLLAVNLNVHNSRKDANKFVVTVYENDERIEFASPYRNYTQTSYEAPRKLKVYIRNDKPLPRTFHVCTTTVNDVPVLMNGIPTNVSTTQCAVAVYRQGKSFNVHK